MHALAIVRDWDKETWEALWLRALELKPTLPKVVNMNMGDDGMESFYHQLKVTLECYLLENEPSEITERVKNELLGDDPYPRNFIEESSLWQKFVYQCLTDDDFGYKKVILEHRDMVKPWMPPVDIHIDDVNVSIEIEGPAHYW